MGTFTFAPRTCSERDARRWARHRMTWAVAATATCLAMAGLMALLLGAADRSPGTPSSGSVLTGLGLHSAVALVGAVVCLLVVAANGAVLADPRDPRPLDRLAGVPRVMFVVWVLAVVAAAVVTGMRPSTVAMVAASAPMAWIPAVVARTTHRAPRPA